MQITGGRVCFSRTVQPAPYESKKGDVELSFMLDDNESIDDALNEVKDICKEHVLELVGARK